MRAIVIEPGKKAEVREIENSLVEYQGLVDGWIETTYPFNDDVCVVCNDEGKLIGLEPNVEINGSVYVGTIVIVGLTAHGTDFGDLSEEQKRRYLEMFKNPKKPTTEDVERDSYMYVYKF